MNHLTEEEARELVTEYMQRQRQLPSTQALLQTGAIPQLRGFVARAGKVSDSIHGGQGAFTIDEERWEREFQPYMHGLRYTESHFVVKEDGQEKNKVKIAFENPLLVTKDNIPLRLMIRTERISTHDISRGEIPFKDQILAMNHHVMRNLVRDILGTSQYDVAGLDATSVVIAAENLKTIPVEMVLRAYMAKSSTSTSLYQAWFRNESMFCGHPIPRGLIANGRLPYVMDTPSTKSEERDRSLSPEEVFQHGLCTSSQYQQIRNASLVAFGVVSHFVKDRGLILVDTKTEHGINRHGQIVSQDELYTLDSSRFWLTEDYQTQLERLARGNIQEELNPTSYSKEFARGFSVGTQGYTDEQRREIAVRYIMGIQQLTGQPFRPDMRSWDERATSGLEAVVQALIT